MIRTASLAFAAFALASPVLAQEAVQPENTYDVGAVNTATATSYMVVAAHPAAAEAGRAVLAMGGTAADAAVAVQLMLTLVEPQSSGLGGGAFAVYWDASAERLTTYDGRETAPLAADESYWLGEDGEPIGWRDAVPGGKSVGVPGTPALLQHLLDKHGKTPRGRLAAPAILAARYGFEVSPRMAASIATGAERGLKAFPAAADYFFDDAGAPLVAGALLKNEALAQSFEAFAADGAALFYSGAIAKDILWETVGAPMNPGMLTPADFAAYKVVERPAVCAPYRGHEVCGMGPPSSGALTVGQILMMLEHQDMTEMGATAWQRYVEASRLAYADRGLYMADSDFVDMPEGLLDAGYMKVRAALIGDAAGEVAPGTPPWKEGTLRAPDTDAERPGTSHFVIRDQYGDIISMTTTIETGFGSRLMAGGYLLNNELTDFSRAPERDGAKIANRVQGGKRPRSSMAPTIVMKDGAPVMALGSPGGSRIIGYVATSLIGMIDWGMTPAEAAAMGHVTASDGRVDLEEGTEAATLADDITAFGLEPRIRDLNSGLSIMVIENGMMTGAADPRREGVALGK
jgi:gamma-glutamyltranspeptidase/glutathione hydrolase